MTRAIIYTPRADYLESAARCMEHVEQNGYEFKGVVQDWSVVQDMFGAGEVSVAIVADPRDLDPQRKPRVEFASHPAPAPNQPTSSRWERTRIIRRNAGG